jgi:hypothetical protein
MSYGLAGTSPFATWAKPASLVLADFFAAHWSSLETGAVLNTSNYPVSEVAWNQWYNAEKDVTIKFYDSTSVIKSQGNVGIGNWAVEEDKIILVHIFARSYDDDAVDSTETMLFNIEEHFKKVLMQNWIDELIPKGILKAYVRNSYDRPFEQKTETYNATLRRRIMTIILRVWRINQ